MLGKKGLLVLSIKKENYPIVYGDVANDKTCINPPPQLFIGSMYKAHSLLVVQLQDPILIAVARV